jgi:hypothetical protein
MYYAAQILEKQANERKFGCTKLLRNITLDE